MVTNSGDLDGTELYYYRGHQVIEVRDGSENVIRQIVHGTRYVDEVVLEILEDGVVWVHQAERDQCGSVKDWNVIALILDTPERAEPACRYATRPRSGPGESRTGRALEHYYYTPYGIMTVDQESYFGDSDGDGKVTEAEWDTDEDGQLDSDPPQADWGSGPSGVCRLVDFDFDGDVDASDATRLAELDSTTTYRQPGQPYSGIGNTRAHQGLIYDGELGSYNSRARQYHGTLRAFGQRDPLATGILIPLEPPKRIVSGRSNRSNPIVREYTQPVVRAGSGYQDGLNLYECFRSSPVVNLDPQGLSTRCGSATCKCGSGDKGWAVHGDSARAKLILLGGDGCVTLLIPKGIFCTGSCDAIKGWKTAGGVSILEHECCHACDFEDVGLCKYLLGALFDTCDDRPKGATPDW